MKLMTKNNRTGPTEILKRCPLCGQLVRVLATGRIGTHDQRQKKWLRDNTCPGSGMIPDPTETP
jgi:hypothetical protein